MTTPESGAGACEAAIRAAAGDRLSDDEVLEIAERIQAQRRKLAAEGKLDNIDRRLAELAREEGDKAKLAAALQRKHAALNAIVRDRLENRVAAHLAEGLDARKAILAILEGSTRGIEEGRNSVAATKLAFESRYMGSMLSAIERDRPQILGMLRDPAFNEDVVREMFELRAGGEPGRTGNADAAYAAKQFAAFAELARTDLNRLGANIGKLDGWAGPQVHDPYRLLPAGEEAWLAKILPRLDLERSFPDAAPAEVPDILREIYTTIVTGRDNVPSAREKGEHVGPANLARSLARQRVLHFKSADDWLAYQGEFGQGNIVTAMVAHLNRSARIAAQMQLLGPNPEVMVGSLIDSLKRRIRNDKAMTHEARRAAIASLGDAGVPKSIRDALAEAQGMTLAPENVTGAAIGNGIRQTLSMAKLGGATISSISDVITAAANFKYKGGSFLGAMAEQLRLRLQGRPKGEQAELSYLIGEGFDGIVDHIVSRFHAEDAVPGRMSALSTRFFRWTGLTWWTDVGRSVAGRMEAAFMGRHAETGYGALDVRFRNVLGQHGIDEARWDIIRGTAWTAENGSRYVTPDRIADLPDEAFADLIAGDIETTRIALKVDEAKTPETLAKREAQLEQRAARLAARARLDLELALRRYLADETGFGIIETDAASRRLLQGTRPGTIAGEAARFVLQFKGFPIAFTQRVIGRAALGQGAATAAQRAGHIGSLIAGLWIAGYMASTAKDAIRGWTPQDPRNLKVILRALVQSGGAGIYGDFLFGEASRFGNSALETAAGPAATTAADIISVFQRAMRGDAKAGEWVNTVLQNTPFLNIWYLRPALDYLVLNELREGMSPGFMRRQERQRFKDYGQRRIWPGSVD